MLDSCQICYPLEIKILLYSCISHLSNAINIWNKYHLTNPGNYILDNGGQVDTFILDFEKNSLLLRSSCSAMA